MMLISVSINLAHPLIVSWQERGSFDSLSVCTLKAVKHWLGIWFASNNCGTDVCVHSVVFEVAVIFCQ